MWGLDFGSSLVVEYYLLCIWCVVCDGCVGGPVFCANCVFCLGSDRCVVSAGYLNCVLSLGC